MNDTTTMPALLACRLPATSKKQILQDLSDLVARHAGICPRSVLSALVSREKLGTTAIGNGVALPHATIDTLDQSVTLVASLAAPVDFDAPDGRPVDIVCVVLGAGEGQGGYLGAIRFVTDRLKQHAGDMRSATDISQLQSIFTPSTGEAVA